MPSRLNEQVARRCSPARCGSSSRQAFARSVAPTQVVPLCDSTSDRLEMLATRPSQRFHRSTEPADQPPSNNATEPEKVAAAMRFVRETLGEIDIIALWTDSASIVDILDGQATS